MKLDLKNYKNRHSLKSKIGRVVWNIVWLLFFRTTPRWCLNGWRCFLLRLFGAKVGKGVRIQGGVKIWQPWKLIIGENSWIDGGVSLYSVDVISIGDNTVISDGAFICTASHDISSRTFELVTKPIVIEDSAWICSKTMLMPGVKVSEGAVVAAGAVVVKDVEPWTVVGGNPAKVIKKREIRGYGLGDSGKGAGSSEFRVGSLELGDGLVTSGQELVDSGKGADSSEFRVGSLELNHEIH